MTPRIGQLRKPWHSTTGNPSFGPDSYTAMPIPLVLIIVGAGKSVIEISGQAARLSLESICARSGPNFGG